MKRQDLIYSKENYVGNTILEIYKNKRGIEIETYDNTRGSAFISEYYEISEEELVKYGNLWKNGNGDCLLHDISQDWDWSPYKVETQSGNIFSKKKLQRWDKQF